ncbi:MAG: PARP-type zinc finger-containing protein [Candidatus Hodarchaeales archaeon]|jgi:hypothetical protein
MEDDPKLEKAKSSRSTCRTCGQKILKDIYRVGIPYQFTRPDGEKITSYGWYHPKCVPFNSIQSTMNILENTMTIESKDKKELLSFLKKKKEDQEEVLQKPFIEISKSARGTCKKCDKKIKKEVYRVAEPTEVDLEDGRKFFSNKLYHIECYLKSDSHSTMMLEKLIKNSLKRKTIRSRSEADLLEKRLSKDLSIATINEKILALISENPMQVEKLRVLAEEKGINYQSVKKAIEEGLLQGILFEPIRGTIQKL